jgi:ketosteroid isomerase-like protein
MRTCLLALALCFLTHPALAQSLTAADRQQIQELTQAEVTALLAQDWKAFSKQYAEEAIVYPPNAPAIVGKAAITAWIQTFAPMAAMTSMIVQLDGSGAFAYVVGTYTMTFADQKKDVGKYVEIRRRQSDGRWLLIVDIFNSDLPAVFPSK